MANIADNLKRLLGTEGHNIQEVLENADSIGGGSIPYIQFVQTEESIESGDPVFEVGEIRGITDATKYTGPCYINVISSTMTIPAPGITMLGSAYSYPLTTPKDPEDEVEYVSIYSIMVITMSVATVMTFKVYINGSVDFNTFTLNGSSGVPSDGSF